MIDPRHIELMNLELDGKASPAEREALRRHLSSHPAAAAHYEALARVVRRLDAEPLVEAPPELHPRIMSGVDRAVRAPSRAPGFTGLFAAQTRRTFTTFGLGLATGVFLLAAVQFGWPGNWDAGRRVDPSVLSGTMAPPPADPDASIVLDPAADGLGGTVQLSLEHGVTVIETRFESPDPVEWSLTFGSHLGVTRVEAPEGSSLGFGASTGEVAGRHAGSGNYRIVLSGRADPAESVVLKVVKNGQVVVERTASPID